MCKVGQDTFGCEFVLIPQHHLIVPYRTDMIKNFQSRGISTANVIVSNEAATGVATILVADDGSAIFGTVHPSF